MLHMCEHVFMVCYRFCIMILLSAVTQEILDVFAIEYGAFVG